MDYLSGKVNNVNMNEKEDKKSKAHSSSDSVFSDFCKTVMGCLNPDEQASISEKFLTREIVSVMKDKELIECINAFFKNNLNISETSRNAFLHRNTLIYRIIKMQRITGIDVRNFTDAVLFNNIMFVRQFMEEHQVEITAQLEAKRQQLLQEQQGF